MSEVIIPKMRKLQAYDITRIVDLINKLDVIDAIKNLMSGELQTKALASLKESGKKADEIDNTSVGYEVFMEFVPQFLLLVPKAQEEVNIFLAELCEMKLEEMHALDFDVYIHLIQAFFEKPELGALMKVVGKFLQ